MTPLSQQQKPLYASTSSLIEWDGDDIPCLGLCKGQAVSKVIYKLGTLVCNILKELDLSDLDLKTLITACATCPQPKATLKVVLDLLINKVVTLETALKTIGTGGTTGKEAVVGIADCFQFVDANGDKVKELTHTVYTRRIGVKVCELIFDLKTVTDDILQLQDDMVALTIRVRNLEADNGEMDKLTEKLDDLRLEFDNLVKILGTNSDIAVGVQAEPDGTIMSLSDPTKALWNTASKTVADSFKKVWLALIDVRTAVKIIQNNCCKISCDDIKIDFDAKVSDDGKVLTLFFAEKSHLPTGFVDAYILGNTLSILDSKGHLYKVPVKIADAVVDLDGVPIDLTRSSITMGGELTLTMDAAIKSDSLQCVKCLIKIVGTDAACNFCQIKVDVSHTPGGRIVVGFTVAGVQQYMTIDAGQTRVLPSKAKVTDVFTSGSPTYSATCTLPNAQPLTCFVAYWGIAHTNSGGGNNVLYQNGTVDGYTLNGIKYPFNKPVSIGFAQGKQGSDDIITQLQQSAIKDTVFEPCVTQVSGDAGTMSYISFKTLNSIGSNMNLYGSVFHWAEGPDLSTPIEWPVQTRKAYDDIPENDPIGTPNLCPCVDSSNS